MKLGRILALALVVAALGGYLWWVELPKAKQEAEGQSLVDVKADDVTGVDLVFADRELALRKTGGSWSLVKPVDAKADDAAVKALVAAITGAKSQKSLDDTPTDLAAFGLDKPDPLIRLATGTGAGPTIAIGKNTTIGGKTYVRVGDAGKIQLTAQSLKFGVTKQPKDLRDKILLDFQDDDVKAVTIAQPGQAPITLTRKDKDAWTIEPGGRIADPTEARSYLASLRATRAIDFPADATAASAGLDAPRLTVTLDLGDKGTQVLEIGNEFQAGESKQLYGRRAGQPAIVALGEWSWRTLAKDANALRDKTVLGFSPDRVGRVVVERKTGTGATLVRSGDAWTVENAPAGRPVREGVITRFLDDLRDLRGASVAAENVTDLKPFGLDAPALRITLYDRDGQAMGTILGAQQADKYYATREGSGIVYEVRDYMYQRLDKQQPDFLAPDPATAGATPPAQAGPGTAADDDPDVPADDLGADGED